MNRPIMYYFLSFVNQEINENMGVCIVDAPNLDEAIRKAWKLGINPGGQVSFAKIEKSEMEDNDLELDRLYSKQDMMDRGYMTIKQQHNRLHEN